MVHAPLDISFSQSEIRFLVLSDGEHGDLWMAIEPNLLARDACRHFALRSSDDGDGRMADVVNLKRFRKRTEKQSAAKQADANRARFWPQLNLNVRRRRTARAIARTKLLDQHRLDDGDAS